MLNITLPVYFTRHYKNKDDKTFLVSLNWFRNAVFHEQNKVKRFYHTIITEQLGDVNQYEPLTQYKVTYNYYYKNSTSDLSNVTTMCSKWVNDTLQELKLIQNDNVKFLLEETHRVAGKDTTNPRVEISIKEL